MNGLCHLCRQRPQRPHGSKCVECHRTDQRNRRRRSVQEYRRRNREWYTNNPEAAKKMWADGCRKHRAKHPDRNRARRMLNKHVADGKISRPAICSRCGLMGRIQAHHPDYSKPLDVVWLCRDCHYIVEGESKCAA